MHTHPVIIITSRKIDKANRAPRISIDKVFAAKLANVCLSIGCVGAALVAVKV